MAKKLHYFIFLSFILTFFSANAQNNYWKKKVSSTSARQIAFAQLEVNKGTLFSLDENSFKEVLRTISSVSQPNIVYFPNAKGSAIPYSVVEAPVLSKDLALKYPEIKSYIGTNLKYKGAKVHFSVSPKGVDAMFTTATSKNRWYIEKTKASSYVLYDRQDDANTLDTDLICGVVKEKEQFLNQTANYAASLSSKTISNGTLTTYRLAVSATGEYTTYHGGTVSDALAAITATITRVNAIFHRDMGITFELVANTDKVIYTNASTDPYTNHSDSEFLEDGHDTMIAEIGSANFDIGHTFHAGSEDGTAWLGATCRNAHKGKAYSSRPIPAGDAYALIVAHEMGHQFGADHTFSFSYNGSGAQVEPGSGSTIMAYGGIAGGDNVVSGNSDYFHFTSIEQMKYYLEFFSCGSDIITGNNTPILTVPGNFNIPIGTAFLLEGSAIDADSDDILTYTWEQIDDGYITQANFGPTNTNGANFRSLPPSLEAKRYFPNMQSVLQGDLIQTNPMVNSAWETVSNVERELNFALSVRDNAINGGQVVSNYVRLSVIGSSGPFIVNSQATNEIYNAGETMTINWNVANTNSAPIFAEYVDIMLSIDGGSTFPITLASNVLNDGNHQIIAPGVDTENARIILRATNNIFFAVNAADFTINNSEIVLKFEALEHEICQGVDFQVDFNYETYLGFNETVMFSAEGLPAGVNAIFSSNSASSSNTPISMTLTNTENFDASQHDISVVAISDTISKSVVLSLNVISDEIEEIIVLTPVNNRENFSTTSNLEWEANTAFSSFDIEIATDQGFLNIIESATTFFNTYTPTSLAQNTAYYWRVKPKNNCISGVFNTGFKFTTAPLICEIKDAEDLPKVISSSGTPTITSSIFITDDIIINDLNIMLAFDHRYLGDLSIWLTSPSGTRKSLFAILCADPINISLIIDDESDLEFSCDDVAATNGTFKPIEALVNFEGESVRGEWLLEIYDAYDGDGGNLTAFAIQYCNEDKVRPDLDNDGVFDDTTDLCLDTPRDTTVNENGCEYLDFTDADFQITTLAESCETGADGELVLIANLTMDYDVTINGEPFQNDSASTTTFTKLELTTGVYDICIDASNGSNTYNTFCTSVIVDGNTNTCVETRPDADNDGVYDDGDDLCLGTAEGVEVNENGCEIIALTADNFIINVQNRSCSDTVDGAVEINSTVILNYTVTVTGENLNQTENFTGAYTFDNLSAGNYTLCFSAVDATNTYSEYCFDTVITELDNLLVSAAQNASGNELAISLSGAAQYFITLNDVEIQTTDSEMTLDLNEGVNLLKVSTNNSCQVSFEKTFYVSTELMIYPNPFDSETTILFGSPIANFQLEIYDYSGQLISSKSYNEGGAEMKVDLDYLQSGVYFIYVKSEFKTTISRVIKR
ncbi:reprolysin-like metallopeptidase [Maribacter sp. IgM3_T14_3]|uniref:reprolysin-like metallopeptidase n=1 Tax=Maribacter sp. IgM3_T14_3 TaxID=3415140 RepID=UPI003C704221